MKKFFFVAIFIIAGIQLSNAQSTKFGLTAGYLNAEANNNFEDFNVTENVSGFYIGALADISISEKFHITPGINYGKAEEANFLYIPVMAQYYIAESGFFLQGGPQATLYLEKDEFDEVNTFGLDLGFGAGYQITEKFFIDAKYSFELTNRLNGEMLGEEDADSKINTFFVGVGYKF